MGDTIPNSLSPIHSQTNKDDFFRFDDDHDEDNKNVSGTTSNIPTPKSKDTSIDAARYLEIDDAILNFLSPSPKKYVVRASPSLTNEGFVVDKERKLHNNEVVLAGNDTVTPPKPDDLNVSLDFSVLEQDENEQSATHGVETILEESEPNSGSDQQIMNNANASSPQRSSQTSFPSSPLSPFLGIDSSRDEITSDNFENALSTRHENHMEADTSDLPSVLAELSSSFSASQEVDTSAQDEYDPTMSVDAHDEPSLLRTKSTEGTVQDTPQSPPIVKRSPDNEIEVQNDVPNRDNLSQNRSASKISRASSVNSSVSVGTAEFMSGILSFSDKIIHEGVVELSGIHSLDADKQVNDAGEAMTGSKTDDSSIEEPSTAWGEPTSLDQGKSLKQHNDDGGTDGSEVYRSSQILRGPSAGEIGNSIDTSAMEEAQKSEAACITYPSGNVPPKIREQNVSSDISVEKSSTNVNKTEYLPNPPNISSWSRFASAAVSAASSAVGASRPLLVEAHSIVQELAHPSAPLHNEYSPERTRDVSSKSMETVASDPQARSSSSDLVDSLSLSQKGGDNSNIGQDPAKKVEMAQSDKDELVESVRVDKPKADESPPIATDKKTVSSWTRFALVAASTARSATKAVVPVMSDAAEIIGSYDKPAVNHSQEGRKKEEISHCVPKSHSPLNSPRLVEDAAAKNLVGSAGSSSGEVQESDFDTQNHGLHLSKPPKTNDIDKLSRSTVSKSDFSLGQANRPKGSVLASVSSVSSTISYGSTGRGVPTSGTMSPLLIQESPSLSGSLGNRPDSVGTDSRPPLFPRKNLHPAAFVALLSDRLAQKSQEGSLSVQRNKWAGSPGTAAPGTASVEFENEVDASLLSPPGSPPNPNIENALDRLSSDGEETLEGKVTHQASLWDMVLYTDDFGDFEEYKMSLNPSSFPGGYGQFHDDGGLECGSDPGESSRRLNRSHRFSDFSNATVRKRRPHPRRLSLSSRGSGRHSTSSRGSGKPRQSLPEDFSGKPHNTKDNESHTTPAYLCSPSPGARRLLSQKPLGSSGKSMSTPDLMLLGRHDSRHTPDQLFSSPLSPIPSSSRKGHSKLYLSPGLGSSSPSQRKLLVTSSLDGADILLYGEGTIEIGTPALSILDETRLEEALMKFSSVEALDFPFTPPLVGEDVACVKVSWQQLVGRWRHSEIAKGVLAQDESLRLGMLNGTDVSKSQDVSSAGTTASLYHPELTCLKLNGVVYNEDDMDEKMKNLDGFHAHLVDRTLTSISSFVSELGACDSGGMCDLQHRIDTKSTLGSKTLHDVAQSSLEEFQSLVEDISSFASLIETKGFGEDSSRTTFAISVKEEDAIARKANQKYEGNCRRVKDALRARINFPTECSLVSGLKRLQWHEENVTEREYKFEVVRMKNLFSSSADGVTLTQTNLPTGYRHILVNVELGNGLLAGKFFFRRTISFESYSRDNHAKQLEYSFVIEIQFNLSAMFDVLGEGGYTLHRQLSDLYTKPEKRSPDSLLPDHIVSGVIYQASNFPPPREFNAPNVATLPITQQACDVTDGPKTPVRSNKTSASRPCEPCGVNTTAQDVFGFSTPPRDNRSRDAPGARSVPRSKSEAQSLQVLDTESKTHLVRLIRYGSSVLSEQVRDIPSICCLYGLLMCLVSFKGRDEEDDTLSALGNDDEILDVATGLLLKGLILSSQASSTGMTGWLEYGSSTVSDRIVDRPFPLLHNLAYLFAIRGRWAEAEDVLQAAVLRCEQQLPLSHPLTLTTTLDLAGVILMSSGDHGFARGLIHWVSERLASYLLQLERSSFEELTNLISDSRSVRPAIIRLRNRGFLSNLGAFVSSLRKLSDRKLLSLFPEDSPVHLINSGILGDSTAVLANCTLASESLQGKVSSGPHGSLELWRQALSYYKIAFDTLSPNIDGENLANYISLACRMSRCFFEVGEGENASRLLATVVGDFNSRLPTRKVQALADSTTQARFLPKRWRNQIGCSRDGTESAELAIAELQGVCFWQQAIYSAKSNPNAEGRAQAFRLLRQARRYLLQAAEIVPSSDLSSRSRYIKYLQAIEEDAKSLMSLPDEEIEAAARLHKLRSVFTPSPLSSLDSKPCSKTYRSIIERESET